MQACHMKQASDLIHTTICLLEQMRFLRLRNLDGSVDNDLSGPERSCAGVFLDMESNCGRFRTAIMK